MRIILKQKQLYHGIATLICNTHRYQKLMCISDVKTTQSILLTADRQRCELYLWTAVCLCQRVCVYTVILFQTTHMLLHASFPLKLFKSGPDRKPPFFSFTWSYSSFSLLLTPASASRLAELFVITYACELTRVQRDYRPHTPVKRDSWLL